MATEEDRWVGQRIRAAREAAGLSIRQLAEQLGWSDHSRLHSYEAGRRSITVVTMKAIARTLHLPLPALLADSPEEQAVIAHVAGNRERAQQVVYLLHVLDEPAPPDPQEEA
jgi:transcriptional regulator with XRE-family HTH domain